MYILILIPVLVISLVYALYNMGYGWFRNGYSWTAFPKYSKNGVGHIFNTATYNMKKVHRFKQSGSYIFTMKLNKTKGNCIFKILDTSGNILIQLDDNNTQARAEIKANTKYYFVLNTHKFTGSYEVVWEL